MIRKLNFDSDERGVSEVLGAILVFGILVVLLAIIQTQAVPAQNQEIEFQHTLDVQGDFAQYHQAASQVTATGNEQSAAIKTGTNYPSRLLFFNPPSVQGSVRTTDSEPVRIENIESTGEVDDRIDSNINNEIELDSRYLEYEASYNELKQDPTIRYEYGILYTNYGDGTTVQNQGSIIDGTDINLIFQAGDYAETSTAEQSIDIQPVSAPARSVPITSSDDTKPIIIELPSALPEKQWNDLYDPSSSDSVQDITKPPNSDTVRIKLNPSKEYSLRMSRIGLEKDVQRPDGYYIVPAGDKTKSVSEGGTTNVRFEVRDEYNNPVSDVEVKVDRPAGPPAIRNTNSNGKITVPITPDSSGTQTATATIQSQSNVDGCDTSPKAERCKADFTLQVTDLSINPGSGVRLKESYIDQSPIAEFDPGERDNVTVGGQNSNIVKTTFYVTENDDREIAAIRMNVYSTTEKPPTSANMTNSDGSLVVGNMSIGGGFKTSSDWTNDPETLKSKEDTTYGFRFYDERGSPRTVENNDYFVLTVVYQNDERAIYFVSPDGSGE